MRPELQSLVTMLELNGRLFRNSLRDVARRHAESRPAPGVNHMAFIACHLLDARHYLARCLGAELANPFRELFDAAEGIEEIDAYPSLGEIVAEWDRVERTLLDRLAEMVPEELRADSPDAFPVEDPTVLGGITFLLQHEAYHVGQLGVLRRMAGYEGVKYE